MKQQAYPSNPIADLDEQILAALESSVPICERPYLALAKTLSMGEMAIILRIQFLSRSNRTRPYKLNRNNTMSIVKQSNDVRETELTHWDMKLLHLLRQGLPLSTKPFHILAKQLGLSVDEVLFRVQRLVSHGDIKRVGPYL